MNGLFGINGLLGFIVAVAIVVGGAVIVSVAAIHIQKSQATNYYNIENQGSIEMKNVQNYKHYQLIPEK